MEYTVSASSRLDAFLASQEATLSRSAIQADIKEGRVTVNGKVVKKVAFLVSEGDSVVFESGVGNGEMGKWGNGEIGGKDLGLEVLYEDDACLVISKPAGIAVHPGHSMNDDEVTMLHGVAYLFEQRGISFSPDSTLVHRLDKPTTGCLLVAKDPASFQFLQKQFENRTTQKTYLAIVAGVPEHKEATIDAPIGRNLTDRTKMSVLRTSVSRDAKTTYRVLDSVSDCSLVECDLHTGRTHQIRVHLSSIGHPILGDESYSSSESAKVTKHFAVNHLCLHAHRLRFVSPIDHIECDITEPLPQDFLEVLQHASLDLTD